MTAPKNLNIICIPNIAETPPIPFEKKTNKKSTFPNTLNKMVKHTFYTLSPLRFQNQFLHMLHVKDPL